MSAAVSAAVSAAARADPDPAGAASVSLSGVRWSAGPVRAAMLSAAWTGQTVLSGSRPRPNDGPAWPTTNSAADTRPGSGPRTGANGVPDPP